jgi:hypothetical protein
MVEPLHGTRARWLHPRFKCRCDLCRVAQRDYMRSYVAKKRLSKTQHPSLATANDGRVGS